MLFSTIQSGDGQYMIINRDSITHVSSDQSKILPYSVATEFPVMCDHQYTNCHPLLQHGSQVVIPRCGPVKHFLFNNNTLEESGVLNIENCIAFFPTGKPLETGAVCIQNTTEEILVALYKIQYHEYDQKNPRVVLEVRGNHIELDSPILITNDTDGKPVVLYITYHKGWEENCMVMLQWNSDNPTFIPLPPTCQTGPYEIKLLGQYNALIKCSSGKLVLFNGDDLILTELTTFDDISMVESCVGKTSFVAVQDTNILLNNTKSIMQIPLFSIKFRSNTLQQISSIACHFNGNMTILYFTTTWNGYIYYLSVPLEDIAQSSTAVEATEIRPAEQFTPFQTVLSSVAGSSWVSILHNEDSDKRKLVLTDMRTGKTSSYPANGLVYVISFSNDLYGSSTLDKQVSVTPSYAESDDTKKWPMPVGITAAILATIVGICLSILVYWNCKRPTRSRGYRTLPYNGDAFPCDPSARNDDLQMGSIAKSESSQSVAPLTTLVESEIGNDESSQPPINRDGLNNTDQTNISSSNCDDPLNAQLISNAETDVHNLPSTDNAQSPVQTTDTSTLNNAIPTIPTPANALHSSINLFGSSQIFEPAAEESTAGTPQHTEAVVGSRLLLTSANTNAMPVNNPPSLQDGDDGNISETDS